MEGRGADADREDVRRVLAGDVEAFAGIVQRWQGPLVNLAYRYCRDPGKAEEMAQDAFVRAFRFLDRWRGDAAFSTWLFAVAIRTYRACLRRAPPRAEPLDGTEVSDGAGDPERALGTARMADLVRGTVSTLPARYRDAIILYYFLELDVAEASRVLGVPAGTVKARLHRARALLRRRLAARLAPRARRAKG